MIERQEIFCHDCGFYVQFDIDVELNGNHVLTCPKCGHEHCRVVENGIVTDVRWGQRNNNVPTHFVSTHTITVTNSSSSSIYVNLGTCNGSGTAIMSGAWLNSSSAY